LAADLNQEAGVGATADSVDTSMRSKTKPDPGLSRDRVPVLRLEEVSKTYEGSTEPAVRHINIEVGEGEFFSILGPSGSGKTTTLRVIGGFERPTSGRVYLGGADVTFTPSNKRDVNTVFQNYALFPHMTARENVSYPLRMRRVDRHLIGARVEEMFAKVEMTGYEDRKPNQLSGGQRQRIALARALVVQPSVLLLDEPLGALDLKLRETMLVVLRALQRDIGITFVYVTHDQGEALGMSDRIAVMNHRGLLEQIASPDDLYWRPASDFVARFIGKTNLLDCIVDSEGGLVAGSLKIAAREATDGPTSVQLSLRPEEISVGPDTSRLANHFRARVEEILFLGHEKELVTTVEDQTLIVRVPGREKIRREQIIEIGWDLDAAVPVKQSVDQTVEGAE
jgi:spermidine/putrescine transport system ATP-binding protein